MYEDEIPVGKAENLKGKQFGAWTVLYRVENTKSNRTQWKCQCSCGNISLVQSCHLKSGASTRCRECYYKSNIIDLTGQRFGRLVVLESTDLRSNSSVKWKCQCDCGNICYVSSMALQKGDTQSCGCLSQEKRIANHKDLTGQRFGRLVARQYLSSVDTLSYSGWLCDCDCGNETFVLTQALTSGATTSCGCYAKECTRERLIQTAEDLTGQIFGNWHVLNRDMSHIGNKAYWICKCKCGTIRSVAAQSLKAGTSISCGCSGASKGEMAIKNILDINFIKYETEKTFPSCRFPKTNYFARFDFFIDNKYIVEFDGKFHYQTTSGWNTEEHFQNTQERDQYKNQWCKDNNIPLIRIPYTHLDNLCIEDLLLETTQFRVV